MNCGVCAKENREQTAVAVCSNCGIGLCLEHFEAEQSRLGPGGTSIGCGHGSQAPAG